MILQGAHEETAVDRILTLQERIRAKRAMMRREGVPLLEQEAVIARMAEAGANILLNADASSTYQRRRTGGVD